METPAQPVNQPITEVPQPKENIKKFPFSSKSFVLIIVGVVVLTFLIGGYLFFKMKNTTPDAITTDKNQPTLTKSAENAVLQDNVLYTGDYKDCKRYFLSVIG